MLNAKVGHILIVAIAAALMVGLAPQAARAQKAEKKRVLPPPLIAVIDFKRAVEESTAGKSVRRQINERHARVQKKISQDTAQLEKQKEELERQRAILAPDVFKQKWREFQYKVQQYNKSVQIEQKKLDSMLNHGMVQVEAKLVDVLREMAQELGANIIIDAGPGRGSVLFTDALLVITDDAVKRLNKILPDIKVEEPKVEVKKPPQQPRLKIPKAQ